MYSSGKLLQNLTPYTSAPHSLLSLTSHTLVKLHSYEAKQLRGKLECERRTTTVLTFKLVGKATLVDVDKRLKNFKFLGRSNQMERRSTPFRWDSAE
ncbi:hypothetical protein OUZ56_027385 [Daphnia magna]|uniref:Uncharacterized protein n=1 Tax=Daphnia magna TaxID=35525 RepID=A0ABQ9ZQJ1_9CRUS|nr:hypothetical protein OUZ56_027385 [Daphnia magna]